MLAAKLYGVRDMRIETVPNRAIRGPGAGRQD